MFGQFGRTDRGVAVARELRYLCPIGREVAAMDAAWEVFLAQLFEALSSKPPRAHRAPVCRGLAARRNHAVLGWTHRCRTGLREGEPHERPESSIQ